MLTKNSANRVISSFQVQSIHKIFNKYELWYWDYSLTYQNVNLDKMNFLFILSTGSSFYIIKNRWM